MRRLPRRLVLPIFGVFWITVLLFFWVTKKNLEVSTGPEVQTPKVRGLAARRARGSGFAGGRAARARCLQALGKPGRGSGCCEQVTGRRMRLPCDISGFKKARGHLQARRVGRWEWVWVVGARSRAERDSQLGQRAAVPGRRGRCGPAEHRVAVCGLRETVVGVWVWWQGRPVLEPARSLAAALTSFHPAAARPDRGRPEARGAPRVWVSGKRPAASRIRPVAAPAL